jgi:hypothetical protein
VAEGIPGRAFDAVLVRYALDVTKVADCLAGTHTDRLLLQAEWQIATHYDLSGVSSEDRTACFKPISRQDQAGPASGSCRRRTSSTRRA